jgi:hypothetical protein
MITLAAAKNIKAQRVHNAELEKQKYNQAFKDHPIIFTTEFAGTSRNTYPGGTQYVQDDYKVTLMNPANGLHMDIDYHVGTGHRIYYGEGNKEFLRVHPSLFAVLYCIYMDTHSTDRCFENWADELGYDGDSRRAEAIYNSCKQEAEDWHTTFPGHDLQAIYETFLEDY